MKPSTRPIKVVSALVAAVFCLAAAQAQIDAPRTVLVKAIVGEARYSTGGGEFKLLTTGTRLGPDTVIKTGRGTHVDLDMGGKDGLVQVSESTTISIKAQIDAPRTVLVKAIVGEARYSTGGEFKLLTPGTRLEPGTTIKTGRGANVDLDLGGKDGLVQVSESTTISIN